jgi:hypothetical protein
MSMYDEDSVIAPVRRIYPATMAKVSPPPPPEEIFADWLISVPHDACIEEAARRQIELIDRRNLLHPDVQRLRLLLLAIAGTTHWSRSIPNL